MLAVTLATATPEDFSTPDLAESAAASNSSGTHASAQGSTEPVVVTQIGNACYISPTGPITLTFQFAQGASALSSNAGAIQPGTLTATLSGGGLAKDETFDLPATCDDALPLLLEDGASITAKYSNKEGFCFKLNALQASPAETGVERHMGTVGMGAVSATELFDGVSTTVKSPTSFSTDSQG